MFIFMQQIKLVWALRILFPSIMRVKIAKFSLVFWCKSQQILNGSLNAIHCLLDDINNGTRYILNIKTCSVRQRINAVSCCRGICLFISLFIFNYRALFVCVKDRICLRIAIPATASTFLDQLWVSCFVYLLDLNNRKSVTYSEVF